MESRWGFEHAIAKTDWTQNWGETLPFELLERIVEALTPNSKELINIDYKWSLSVESFGSVLAPGGSGISNTKLLGNWRKVSRRFAVVGAKYIFARISIRLTQEDIPKLFQMVQNPDACAKVKKFSYMIHGFSSLDTTQFQDLLAETRAKAAEIQQEIDQRANAGHAERQRPTIGTLRHRLGQCKKDYEMIQLMMLRTADQGAVTATKRDEAGLLGVFKAFQNLEQIRLMPCHEDLDDWWTRFCRDRPIHLSESKSSRWSRACEHAGRTLAAAFFATKCPAKRISVRRLPPLMLIHTPRQEITGVTKRLNCLELNFDDRSSLDREILELSDLFKAGFDAAEGIQGLHIGFTRPVSIAFDSVFHDIYWKHLRYIGLVAWRMRSEDIIQFLRRHRNSLRGVRLRGALLEEGSYWVDILRVLRRDMGQSKGQRGLKWVSLRWVGYSGQQPVAMPIQHAHYYHHDSDSSDSDFGLSESDDSTDDPNIPDIPTANDEAATEDDLSSANDEGTGEDDDQSNDADSSGGDSEVGTGVNELAIDDQHMVHHIEASTEAAANCSCHQGYAWDDLRDDNGMNPPKTLWKWWEIWVARRCPLGHDPDPEVG